MKAQMLPDSGSFNQSSPAFPLINTGLEAGDCALAGGEAVSTASLVPLSQPHPIKRRGPHR